jgi:phosphatidylserine/phosphatidylglycerophosphate/cardiolipin synthase-like enzyme
MQFAWALERMDPNAAAWIFPNAYHIKVIVRDGTSFWLSSGNLNNSNQPDITPLTDPTGSAATARKSDRDWHVIVEEPKLAGMFKKFLLNDLEVASKHQTSTESVPSGRAGLGELAASESAAASVPARAPKTYFPPKKITANMKIQPLLTPDNYCDFVLPLIQSAKQSFYMQTQYIHPSSKPDDTKLASLIQAVVALIEAGVDVRLITSQFENQPWLEKVQDAGIDLSHLRLQNAVHNKGIVVDSKVVMVSSQNWSGDGVARNRDAGLIIYNEDAAKYFEQIFLHDWTKMAVQSAPE